MRPSLINKQEYSLVKINKKLFIVNLILIVAFFISQIAVTHVIGTKAQEVDNTRTSKGQLREENKFLEAEIAKLKSLSAIKDVADKYNLVEKNVTYLDAPNFDSVALN